MRREWIVVAHEFAHVARVRAGGEADQTHTLGRFEGVFGARPDPSELPRFVASLQNVHEGPADLVLLASSAPSDEWVAQWATQLSRYGLKLRAVMVRAVLAGGQEHSDDAEAGEGAQAADASWLLDGGPDLVLVDGRQPERRREVLSHESAGSRMYADAARALLTIRRQDMAELRISSDRLLLAFHEHLLNGDGSTLVVRGVEETAVEFDPVVLGRALDGVRSLAREALAQRPTGEGPRWVYEGAGVWLGAETADESQAAVRGRLTLADCYRQARLALAEDGPADDAVWVFDQSIDQPRVIELGAFATEEVVSSSAGWPKRAKIAVGVLLAAQVCSAAGLVYTYGQWRQSAAEVEALSQSGAEDGRSDVQDNESSTAVGAGGEAAAFGAKPYREARTGIEFIPVKARSLQRKGGRTLKHPDPFLVARTEVTVAQFRTFVEATAHKTLAERANAGGTWRDGGDEEPVAFIAAEDAEAFCAWLSRETGMNVALPTEVQWELAARAGQRGDFVGGDSLTGQQANFGQLRWRLRPVTNGGKNAIGLHGVHGNAAEIARKRGGGYVLCGGSAKSSLGQVAFDARQAVNSQSYLEDAGFRPVMLAGGR